MKSNVYQILTPSGWSDFQGLRQIKTKFYILLKLSNGNNVKCTLNHRIKMNSGTFKRADEIKINDILYGNIIVTQVQTVNSPIQQTFFDVVRVQKDNQYLSQGIVNHNCGGDCISGNSIISLKNNVGSTVQNLTIQQAFKLYPYDSQNPNFLNVKILTPSGWSNFNGIRKIYTKKTMLLKTQKDFIQCTLDHKMKMQDGTFQKAININVGDFLYHKYKVVQIKIINVKTQVYDAINVQLGNQFYANNLVVSNCILLSTPRGCGHTFHKLWMQAQQRLNPFNTIKLPWFVHPQRDQEWRDKQTKALGQKKSNRQFDCSFASSGDTVINDLVLNSLQEESCQDPIQMHCNEKLWIWKHPQQEKNYIVSADVARGDGEDYSAFHIICVQDDQQVGQYKGKINTKDYGNLLVQWATKYNNAQLIVQNANIGWAVLQQIIDLQYKNVYYHKKDFKYVDTQLHSKMKRTKSSDLQKDILGFSTTSKTRPLIIQKTMLLIQTKQFIIRSKRLINQLRTFIWINGRAQAMGGYNDDLTMSLCIGVWVRNTSYMLKKQAANLTRQRLANINSGLNIRDSNQKKVLSGFYSGANATTDKNVVAVGNQNINLNDFYFKK